VSYQNGVVEHKNRTLIEMARMMLDEYKTPRCFWAEVINIAYYISNRIYLRLLLKLTPFELCLGRQSFISHLGHLVTNALS
jgi:hypothetical protein